MAKYIEPQMCIDLSKLDYQDGGINCLVIDPYQKTMAAEVVKTNSSERQIVFLPKVTGNYAVYVYYGGKQLPDSPFWIHKGIRGFVRSKSGNPIEGAHIHIDDRSHISHSGKAGDFWRILEPGTYDLKVIKEGYVTAEKKSVQVSNGSPTSVNFFMAAESADSGNSDASLNGFPAHDQTETNNQGILQPLNQDNRDSSDMNGYTGFPLLSQIQNIDRQLLRSASMQNDEGGWQPAEYPEFVGPPMVMNAEARHRTPFSSMDEVMMGQNYDPGPLKEFYLDTPRGFTDTQLMMNQLNLEHDDFFDHKSEFIGDQAH